MNIRNSLLALAMLSITLVSNQAIAEEAGETSAAPVSTNLMRAVFTSAVMDREPADILTSLGNDRDKVYFFSELRGLGGQTITHRWEYQGQAMGEVKFNVGGARWRVWSSKNLLPQQTGEWKVVVIDGNGNTIGEASFTYMASE